MKQANFCNMYNAIALVLRYSRCGYSTILALRLRYSRCDDDTRAAAMILALRLRYLRCCYDTRAVAMILALRLRYLRCGYGTRAVAMILVLRLRYCCTLTTSLWRSSLRRFRYMSYGPVQNKRRGVAITKLPIRSYYDQEDATLLLPFLLRFIKIKN